MANNDVLEKAGKKVVLLGNEAIARGAIEAGMGFSASFPGTPSSEVGMTLSSFAKKVGYYCEWSTNEKTAFEASAGAAFSGVRSLTAMKHFGMNVASDSIYPVIYTGVKAGMVMVVADDPQGLSSAQSEQDTRLMAKMGIIPVIEPSNAQECKDLTKLAFEISEEFEIPVMLRTTTRVNHCIGTVKLSAQRKKRKTKGKFKKDKERFDLIRPSLQRHHYEALEKLNKIGKKYSPKLDWTEGKGKIGIITTGVSYQHIKELELKNVKLARIVVTNPISEKFISKFIKNLDKVIVVEELEPVVEDFVMQAAKKANPKLKIHGKDVLPRAGEFSPSIIYDSIAPILKLKKRENKEREKALSKIKLPTRKPVFCPGCPHRSTFYAIKEVLGENVVWGGDIGCYILGIFDPFNMQNFAISMGAGTGISHGISKVSTQKIVSFMGDGTFFHAGMPAIANMKHNGSKALVIIVDNSITAMTGHQPHPGSGKNATGDERPHMRIEDILKGMGIENIAVANSFNQKELKEAVRKLDSKNELGVLVSRGECRLLAKRKMRKKGVEFPTFEVAKPESRKLEECLKEFACPAFQRGKNGITINEDMCLGCGVCMQVCPPGTIKVKKK